MIGVYAGSFDPPTLGHLDIIVQALHVFDRVDIIVTHNKGKNRFLAEKESADLLIKTAGNDPKIGVKMCPRNVFLADFVITEYGHFNACLIRGVRGIGDIDSEAAVLAVNNKIQPLLQTVHFLATPHFKHVSSSLVRSLIGINGWESIITGLVPACVKEYLVKR